MNSKKKYKVIAKVDNEKFVKYNVNNLLSFKKFLDTKFRGWRWFNVYDKNTSKQIANFTNRTPPKKKHV